MEKSLIRTTVTLPKSLLEETDIRVKEGKAKNRNDFIVSAIQKELEYLKKEEIDSLLAEMAQYPEYQAQVLQMEAEFAEGSWEAWEIGEQSSCNGDKFMMLVSNPSKVLNKEKLAPSLSLVVMGLMPIVR